MNCLRVGSGQLWMNAAALLRTLPLSVNLELLNVYSFRTPFLPVSLQKTVAVSIAIEVCGVFGWLSLRSLWGLRPVLRFQGPPCGLRRRGRRIRCGPGERGRAGHLFREYVTCMEADEVQQANLALACKPGRLH